MFEIDKHGRTPIYEQVVSRVEQLVAAGIYEADMQLPSVRNLSAQLSVNPNTLQKAYAELERRGICYTVPGSGRFICADAKNVLSKSRLKNLERISSLCAELKAVGIPKEDILMAVDKAYEEGNI